MDACRKYIIQRHDTGYTFTDDEKKHFERCSISKNGLTAALAVVTFMGLGVLKRKNLTWPIIGGAMLVNSITDVYIDSKCHKDFLFQKDFPLAKDMRAYLRENDPTNPYLTLFDKRFKNEIAFQAAYSFPEAGDQAGKNNELDMFITSSTDDVNGRFETSAGGSTATSSRKVDVEEAQFGTVENSEFDDWKPLEYNENDNEITEKNSTRSDTRFSRQGAANVDEDDGFPQPWWEDEDAESPKQDSQPQRGSKNSYSRRRQQREERRRRSSRGGGDRRTQDEEW